MRVLTDNASYGEEAERDRFLRWCDSPGPDPPRSSPLSFSPPAEIPATGLVRGNEPPKHVGVRFGTGRLTIGSMMFFIAVVAVGFAVMSVEPLIGGLYLSVVVPAHCRTLFLCRRAWARGKPMRPPQVADAYFESLLLFPSLEFTVFFGGDLLVASLSLRIPMFTTIVLAVALNVLVTVWYVLALLIPGHDSRRR